LSGASSFSPALNHLGRANDSLSLGYRLILYGGSSRRVPPLISGDRLCNALTLCNAKRTLRNAGEVDLVPRLNLAPGGVSQSSTPILTDTYLSCLGGIHFSCVFGSSLSSKIAETFHRVAAYCHDFRKCCDRSADRKEDQRLLAHLGRCSRRGGLHLGRVVVSLRTDTPSGNNGYIQLAVGVLAEPAG